MDKVRKRCQIAHMKFIPKSVALAAFVSAIGFTSPQAQISDCATDAMLVFDGSGSMGEITFDTGPNTRFVEARQTMLRAMPEIDPIRRVGLLVYGPGPLGVCDSLD